MPKHLLAPLLALAILVGTGSLAAAHQGHDHKVMGTVTMAAADHLMVKDTAGKEVTIRVGKETKVRSKPAMKVEAIAPGTRVVVTATMDKNEAMTAKTIEVGAAPAAAK